MTTLIGSDSFGLTSVWPKTGDMAVNATVRQYSSRLLLERLEVGGEEPSST